MLIYNIPVSLMPLFAEKKVVLRSSDAAELARIASEPESGNIMWLQLLSLSCDSDPIARLESPLPLDLVVDKESENYPLLYNHARLAATRPVRAIIPLFPGFRKAVRLATSLECSVKLDPGHGHETVGEELIETMHDYLHSCTVSTPIEFYHSLLMLYFHDYDNTLWTIQEEDPEFFRYVTDEGRVAVSRHLPSLPAEGYDVAFLHQVKLDFLSERGACATCPFFSECLGYFRYGNRSFSCHVVKRMFSTLRDASSELKRDLEASRTGSTEERS